MSDPNNYREVLDQGGPFAPDAPAGDGAAALDRVRIEVEPDPSRRGDIGAAEVLERFTARVDELGAAVVGMAGRLRASLQEHDEEPERSGPWSMSQVAIEFGLNLEAETGVVVCKGKTAAAFKIAITWTRREPPP